MTGAPEPARQQPDWAADPRLGPVTAELSGLPSLVSPTAVDLLTERLAEVALGEAFLLQGGDCAESLAASSPAALRRTAGTLEGMAQEIRDRTGLPVVLVGRMAGQYAKPRSRPTEHRGGLELPAYRGDAVNGSAFTPAARAADPRRLLRCYRQAHRTLTHLRRASGAEFFVSHESLLLDYELPLTRRDHRTGRWYNGSTHLPWIGERTRHPAGPHVAHAQRIANPVAVKIGPTARPDEVAALVDRLDPDRVPGRLTFIARMGHDRVRDALPPLVQRSRREGSPAPWVCDPMHGNTTTAPSGHKTRHLDHVVAELDGYFAVLRMLGLAPAGVHLELTGEPVTECVGPIGLVRLDEVGLRYRSACDPRLNGTQARLVAEVVADRIAYRGGGDPVRLSAAAIPDRASMPSFV